MMRFGMHLSMSGRLADAPDRGRAIGCRALQIFCGNPRGWTKSPLDPARVDEFKAAAQASRIDPIVVHATYLINLAAPDDHIFNLSVTAFLDELRRSQMLGASYYVVHSGSHKGLGEDAGRARIVEALKRADRELPERPEILLENTAGTSNSLGTSFEDLAKLLDGANVPRTGICFDTCHALAAGYEIRTPEGVAKTLDDLDKSLGLKRLRCLHVNDSKGGLGSRLDRHEHIGKGEIGEAGFRAFFGDRRLWDLPAILETPQDLPDDDRRDLWKAVEIAVAAGATEPELLEVMPTGPQDPVKAAATAKHARVSSTRKAPKPKPAVRKARASKPAARKAARKPKARRRIKRK
ncbi:MAG: deoxyribonuclease IV [Planctomycetota bacterium]|nr:deoxyribonuclease IV [Planctomycetota bacterium]